MLVKFYQGCSLSTNCTTTFLINIMFFFFCYSIVCVNWISPCCPSCGHWMNPFRTSGRCCRTRMIEYYRRHLHHLHHPLEMMVKSMNSTRRCPCGSDLHHHPLPCEELATVLPELEVFKSVLKRCVLNFVIFVSHMCL